MESGKFGAPIQAHLTRGDNSSLQAELLALSAVMSRPVLVFTDKRANTLFAKWANLIRRKGLPGAEARKPWLKAFNYYLLFAIWVLAPIVSLLFLILHLPFLSFIRKETRYYKSVNFKMPRYCRPYISMRLQHSCPMIRFPTTKIGKASCRVRELKTNKTT